MQANTLLHPDNLLLAGVESAPLRASSGRFVSNNTATAPKDAYEAIALCEATNIED